MTRESRGKLPREPADLDPPRLSVERVARGTWTVYRGHLGVILAASAIVALPVYVAQLWLGIRLGERLGDLLPAVASVDALIQTLADEAASVGLWIGGLIVVPFLAWPVLVGTITAMAAESWGRGTVALRPALARGLAAYPSLLAGSVLTALPALAAAGAVLAMSGLMVGTVRSIGLPVIPAYLAGLGVILVALAYAGVRLAVVAPAIVIEALGPLDALRRSWWLTKGNLWRVLGAVVLVSAAVSIAERLVEAALDATIGAVPVDPTVPALVLSAVPTVVFPAFGPILGALLLLGLEGSPTLLAVDGSPPPTGVDPYVG